MMRFLVSVLASALAFIALLVMWVVLWSLTGCEERVSVGATGAKDPALDQRTLEVFVDEVVAPIGGGVCEAR